MSDKEGVIKIDKGIPLPSNAVHWKTKYPMKLMDVGDSFLVHSPHGAQIATTGSFRYKPRRFIARRVPDPSGTTYRIWRIE